MLSILSDAALFCRTKCAGPTIAPTGTRCILSVCLTTWMNPSTQSAQSWGSLYFVGITTAYSSDWGRNVHCWVFFHLLENVHIVFPAGMHSWNWWIWFSGVQLKYIQEEKELGLGRCYLGHCPYIGPRCNEIHAWSLGWHPYCLPCNHVPEAQLT